MDKVTAKELNKTLRTTGTILSIVLSFMLVFFVIVPLCFEGLIIAIVEAFNHRDDPAEHAFDDYFEYAIESGCTNITMIHSMGKQGAFCNYDIRDNGYVTYIIGENDVGEQVFIISGYFTDTDSKYRLGEWPYAYSLSEIAERMTAHGVPCEKKLFDVETAKPRDIYAGDFDNFDFTGSQENIDRNDMQDVLSKADFNGCLVYHAPDIEDFEFYIVQERGELMLYYREYLKYNEFGPLYSMSI